jgi:hypothetical protein
MTSFILDVILIPIGLGLLHVWKWQTNEIDHISDIMALPYFICAYEKRLKDWVQCDVVGF